MAIYAENHGGGGTSAPILEPGNYPARCFSMVHIGTIIDDIPGQGQKSLNKVYLRFELPTETFEFDSEKGPEPRFVGKEFTLSMNEKANLRKFLESWRGKPFTPEQVERFDVTSVIGAPCFLNIINKATKAGKEFADVTVATAVPKGMTVPDQVNERFEFNFDECIENFPGVPAFLRKKIVTSLEWKSVPDNVRARLESIAAANDAEREQKAKASETAQEPAKTTPPAAAAKTSPHHRIPDAPSPAANPAAENDPPF